VEEWKDGRRDWKGGRRDMPPFERSLCVLCDRDVTGKKDLRRFLLPFFLSF
jgi:hypothetical protein